MPLRIVDLPKTFRPGTSHVYPPFKNGRYMEEYVYHYLADHRAAIETEYAYLPVYWTHLQNHPAFSRMKGNYQMLLDRALSEMPAGTRYFTLVQHDDGPQLRLPPDTVVFGACTGTVPLPLIYEDVEDFLLRMPRPPRKTQLASFVGTASTHPLRSEMVHWMHQRVASHGDVEIHVRNIWSPVVGETDSSQFVASTLRSRFCLAPRGYGRSSFRFFEAMQLDTVPVYIWDDVEWLPYKDQLDYSAFSVSIRQEDLPRLWDILDAVTDEQYAQMQESILRVRRYFTLEGMCEYIVDRIGLSGGQCFPASMAASSRPCESSDDSDQTKK